MKTQELVKGYSDPDGVVTGVFANKGLLAMAKKRALAKIKAHKAEEVSELTAAQKTKMQADQLSGIRVRRQQQEKELRDIFGPYANLDGETDYRFATRRPGGRLKI